MHELCGEIVLAHRLVSLEYFLDQMRWYEVDYLCRNAAYAGQDEWEQTRVLAGVVTSAMGSKKSISEILKYPWDGDRGGDTAISSEDVARLKKMMDDVRLQS